MKRYSEYKDSGVKWIGEIPGHWKCIKLHHLISKIESGTSVNGSTSQYAKSNEYGVLKTGAVSFRIFDDKQNKLVEGQEIKRLTCPVVKNTIIVSRMNTPELVGSCAIVEKDYPNLYLPDRLWQVYFTKASNLKFLHWVLNGMYVRTYYASICVGSSSTMQNISQSQFSDTKIAFPPLPEQEAIVTYLDSKVAKIDEYISIAEKKIAALEELKQTIITEAVTRGIHKDVPMKDSGVKWIGMIPEHWEIRRLKNIVLCNSDTLSENFPKEEVIKYVEISDVNYTSGIINVQNISFGEAPSRARRITKKNDVIVSTVRTYLKAVAKIQEDGLIVSTGFAVLHPIIGNSSFLSYFVLSESFINNVIADSKGISYPAISTSDLVCIAMPLPPLSEQQEIVTYLDSKVANINQLCQAERSQIEKLKEYKQRLISDVVTGKVKVTND